MNKKTVITRNANRVSRVVATFQVSLGPGQEVSTRAMEQRFVDALTALDLDFGSVLADTPDWSSAGDKTVVLSYQGTYNKAEEVVYDIAWQVQRTALAKTGRGVCVIPTEVVLPNLK
jgi:hypothetical protein